MFRRKRRVDTHFSKVEEKKKNMERERRGSMKKNSHQKQFPN